MISYIGGKSHLAPWIISNFPDEFEKKPYCEVFGGGGWVLFKKPPSYVETYNDLNRDLVNLFTVIRDHFEEFQHKAEWTLHSREMHAQAIRELKETDFPDNVQRAVSYAIKRVQNFSSGNSDSWGYAVKGKRCSGLWTPFLKKLPLINARLKNVQIECLDFERLIKKYDSPDTLFYVDPPYYDAEFYYNQPGVEFKRADHERLKGVLSSIQGKFSLSYYEHPVIRELYAGYTVLKKDSVKHSCGSVGSKRTGFKKPKCTELLIMNY
jgi:DNA adenine methylase